jgi:hypothetical protein
VARATHEPNQRTNRFSFAIALAQISLGLTAFHCGRFVDSVRRGYCVRVESSLGEAREEIVTIASFVRHFIVTFSSWLCQRFHFATQPGAIRGCALGWIVRIQHSH